MTVLETFAEFASGIRLNNLARADREILGRHLLDTVGAAIAGARTPTGKALREIRDRGLPHVAVFTRGTIDDVALRTASVRHTEVDDIHTLSNVTPGSIIVPTALTLGARLGIDDPQVLGGALIAGYEAINRLGVAIDGTVVLYRGIWPTYFCAPFGAAAVTARLLALSAEQTINALAIALTACTGGTSPPGARRAGRWLTVGQAARAGVAAALAARAGFSGEPALLDGDWMTRVHGIKFTREAMETSLGDRSVLGDLSLKPCCTGKQVAAALAAFQSLLAEGLDAETVSRVEVFVPKRYAAMIDRPFRRGVQQSTFGNTRYQFGLAAFHPDGLFDAARTALVDDPRIDALAAKIAISVDDRLADHMPRCWPARVEVRTPSGSVSREVVAAPGDPDCRFDNAATEAKFHALTDRLIGANAADDWVADCRGALTETGGAERLYGKFDRLFG